MPNHSSSLASLGQGESANKCHNLTVGKTTIWEKKVLFLSNCFFSHSQTWAETKQRLRNVARPCYHFRYKSINLWWNGELTKPFSLSLCFCDPHSHQYVYFIYLNMRAYTSTCGAPIPCRQNAEPAVPSCQHRCWQGACSWNRHDSISPAVLEHHWPALWLSLIAFYRKTLDASNHASVCLCMSALHTAKHGRLFLLFFLPFLPNFLFPALKSKVSSEEIFSLNANANCLLLTGLSAFLFPSNVFSCRCIVTTFLCLNSVLVGSRWHFWL